MFGIFLSSYLEQTMTEDVDGNFETSEYLSSLNFFYGISVNHFPHEWIYIKVVENDRCKSK